MEVDPPHHVVLHGAGTPERVDVPAVIETPPARGYVASTWQWVLVPTACGRRTRLIVRQRATYSLRQTLPPGARLPTGPPVGAASVAASGGEDTLMGLRGMLHRLSTPVEELDEERLREFCERQPDVVPIAAVRAREEAGVVGEVTSVRMVPKVGSPWLEVTISDGRDRMVAMWTGRRRLAGVEPGRRLVLAGRASATGPGGRMLLMNPRYELLPSRPAERG